MPKIIREDIEHARLKDVVTSIMRVCEFDFDREVAFNFTGSKNTNDILIDEKSVDVVAYGKKQNKSFLLLFECKGGEKIRSINGLLDAWETNIDKIKRGKVRLVTSELNKITDDDLVNLDYVVVCYVCGCNYDIDHYEEVSKTIISRHFYCWDNKAVQYFTKTAETVGKWIKYEIFKEFNISFEANKNWKETAIPIKQNKQEMYLFSAHPTVLLKIGYVSRRASGKPQAYQRILNKDRINKVSEFIISKNALLPNTIIIAFDNDPDIQNSITYNNGTLTFPNKYCSAWIIDGQHRVFGFLNTRYENVDPDEAEETFKIPVVAFKNLNEVMQSRTFVNINYNQKKIDPTLLCDIATTIPDLQNELSWPSLIATELNIKGPFKDKIKTSELNKGKPISNTSFARYGLLEGLLGYDGKKHTYNGVLFKFAPFDKQKSIKDSNNQNAFEKQTDLLIRFFNAVKKNTAKTDSTKDPWQNTRHYALLKATGVNALLLVLSRIMEKYPNAAMDLDTYLKPIRSINFKKEHIIQYGGGWKGFRNLANEIIRKLNTKHSTSLRLYGKKEKT